MDWSGTNVGIALGLIVAGYLIGAIPFGLFVGMLRGVDIRTKGSGNIGATNVGRVCGRPWGFLVFGLDMLKGLLPTLVAGKIITVKLAGAASHGDVIEDAGVALLWVLVGAACIIGHMFPIYLKFKGGKGVATSLGVLLGIYPYFTFAALIGFVLWVVLTLLTRYVSVGSVAAALAFPVLFAFVAWWKRADWGNEAGLWPMYLFGVILAGLVVYRHRGNLRRLAEGTEPRIGQSHHRRAS